MPNITYGKKKVSAGYKTIYLSTDVINALDEAAEENNTSFNNVVASMLKYCLELKKEVD